MVIINDDSRVVNKLETSLSDDARVVIYDHQMFIAQATGLIRKYFTQQNAKKEFAVDKHSSLFASSMSGYEEGCL